MKGLELLKNKHLLFKLRYIGGKAIPNAVAAVLSSSGSFGVTNPATGEVLIDLPRMGVREAQAGIEAAHSSFPQFKAMDVKDRAALLTSMAALMIKYQDDLATIISLEAGKPFNEAKGEVMYARSFYELYAEEAKRVNGEILQCNSSGDRRRLLVTKQPIGPCVLITPWNFPCAMITRKLGPALAAGCTAVIKPAEQTPLSALALCAIAGDRCVDTSIDRYMTTISLHSSYTES